MEGKEGLLQTLASRGLEGEKESGYIRRQQSGLLGAQMIWCSRQGRALVVEKEA